ncbi:MAG: sporulation/spore germination protein [Cyanobacteria bacterium P01_G01_bin.38]
MARFPKSFLGLVLALSFVTVACNPSGDLAEPDTAATPTEAEPPVDSTPTTDTDKTSPDPDPKDPVTSQAPDEGETAADLIEVSIYVMDDQCNDFVKRTVQVQADKAMDEAIGQVIATASDFNAFDMSGYRVKFDESTGMAVVDLRLAPDSQRQFVSLSSCEQRTLFGSVEETLMENSDWDVKAVEFTDSGEELVL